MLSDILRSAGSGVVFGAALTASRVYHPSVIIHQLRLADFHMLEVFLTAGATGAFVMLTFEALGIAKRSIRSNSTLNWFSAYDGNIVGGALVGVGMSLTGACPGTVIVQLAQGIPSSRATALGALLGGLFYAKFGRLLEAKHGPESGFSQPGAQTIAGKLNLEPRTVFLAFEILSLVTIVLSTLALPGRSLAIVPPVVGGLLIGVAQAVSILLTTSPLGVSTVYEQVGRYLWRASGFKDVSKPPTPPKAVIFALGVLSGSLAFAGRIQLTIPVDMIGISFIQALIGGLIMAFGARIAGGCTSGHGLSGLSSLSFSSLVTVVAMFGAGITTQMLRT
ncbi:hypothetical protein LTR99_011112 [Exophiala xenobiotica]|uniref:Sulphur transport domain-containing protein n=1 Tax=Vermiconidia calcicola TaxID=1690605 RepID=A0AAV9PSP8_9PEZI|nr:hypothetical protein LTR99_011112 [Exophiala xenobiotica]KAK5425417.1 hypothetical protein LTR34_011122 [Exophiala xenobiotica]KAK5527544.1 hypothetical protein LTR25_011087 [Vermiconidia calcicola]KAK5527720.1 hypothetical protein LTR23_011216 [Chaetothyriales sp. CCFEE 6169]